MTVMFAKAGGPPPPDEPRAPQAGEPHASAGFGATVGQDSNEFDISTQFEQWKKSPERFRVDCIITLTRSNEEYISVGDRDETRSGPGKPVSASVARGTAHPAQPEHWGSSTRGSKHVDTYTALRRRTRCRERRIL